MFETLNPSLIAALAAAALTAGAILLAGFVWLRRRRRAVTGGGSGGGRLVAFLLLVAGVFLLLVSLSFHLLTMRQGELRLHDLFVVRADPERGVPRLVEPSPDGYAAGDVLVRFELPAREAELQAMQFERETVRNELARIAVEATDIDPKISREAARLDADIRLLQQQRQTTRTALGLTQPQIRLEILNHSARVRDAATEIERIRGRMRRNEAELSYAVAVAESRSDLRRQELVAPLEAQLGTSEVAALTADAGRLESELRGQEALRQELGAEVVALRAQLDEHRAGLERDLREVEQELQRLRQRRAAVAAEEQADRDRIAALQATQRRERELRIAALDARIEQARLASRVVAPAAGRVLYRHTSPAASPCDEPVLAFGTEDSVRLHLRMRRAEAARLRAAETLRLRAVDDVEEPRFAGVFLRSRELSDEPGLVLAEVGCAPNAAVFRRLFAEGALDAELDWTPPLYVDPVFDLGLLLLAGGVLVRLLDGWRGRARGLLLAMEPAAIRQPLDAMTR